MGKISKTLLLLLVLIFLTSTILQYSSAKAQSTTDSAPTITWQEQYGNYIQSVSNLIQTSDGGYAFMDLGWLHSIAISPSTVYKVDSVGNLQWNTTLDYFWGSTFVQTNDKGFEVSGAYTDQAFRNSQKYINTPFALIKMDSEGDIQWIKNYSSMPDLGVSPSGDSRPSFGQSVGDIRTGEGGSVYWRQGIVLKTDSNNNTQWIMNLTYPTIDSLNGTAPLEVFSAIETSDGALAILGVGPNLLDNPYTGKIYLFKTEAFLPSPLPTQLPTPLPTAMAITPKMGIKLDNQNLVLLLVIIIILISALATLLLLFKRRHSKRSNSSQETLTKTSQESLTENLLRIS